MQAGAEGHDHRLARGGSQIVELSKAQARRRCCGRGGSRCRCSNPQQPLLIVLLGPEAVREREDDLVEKAHSQPTQRPYLGRRQRGSEEGGVMRLEHAQGQRAYEVAAAESGAVG